MRMLLATIAALAACAAAHAEQQEILLPSPLRALPATAVPGHLRASVAALVPDDATWKAMAGAEHVRLEAVPVTPSRTATLLLHRIDPFTRDARIVSAQLGPGGKPEERPLPRPEGQWWGGVVEGAARSKVMLSRSAAGVLGFVHDEHGTVIIASDRAGGTGPVVSYSLQELPEGVIRWDPWNCTQLQVPGDDGLAQGSAAVVQPCRQMRIAVETDNELYQRFAGAADPAAAATAYIATLFAGIGQIYQTDLQILPHVNFLRLWPTAADPWTQTSTGSQLGELRSYWLGFMAGQPRDLTAMLSTRGLGGGVAWLGTACNADYGFSVSANLAGSFPYPIVDNSGSNWDIIVTSHELGHNVGTPHTHDFCPTPADSCAPSGYFGSCQTAQVCTSAGTIMSYCHLCSGGTANVMLDFHPLCIDAIGGYMTGACNTVAEATPAVAVNDAVATLQATPLQVDLLANDIPVNCETITLESLPAVSSAGGTVTRLVGAGPGGRDLVRYAPPAAFSGTDAFNYRVREASGTLSASATVSIRVDALRPADNPIGDTAGLATSYYDLVSPSVLPDFTQLTPFLSGGVARVNFPSTGGNFAGSGRADNVGAVFAGWLRIDEPGIYTLYLESDDGSRLLVGSTPVVGNDGLHGMVEASGTIALAAGKHAVRIEFFEAGGGAGCIASMAGPGLAKTIIPSDRLTRGGTTNRADLNLDGRVNGVDLGGLLGAWGTAGPLGDVNADGTVNGVDLGLMLGAWTG